MAYTYDDFLSYLPQQGLSEKDFSPEDLALAKSNPTAGVKLMEYKVDWKNAKTDDERALINSEANAYRTKAGGYNGGIDGNNGNSSFTPDDLPGFTNPVQTSMPSPQSPTTQPFDTTGQTPGSFVPGQAPAPFEYGKAAPAYQSTGQYNNQYTDQQKKFMNDITGYKPFEFNAETNPQMQAYTKQYRREGDRAMQDTLGTLSSMTGGIPSTAAASAAGQANDYYMSQLGDKLPQIYESEYNKYLQDFGMLQQKAGYVNGQEQVDYSRYWDGEKFNWDKFLEENDQYNADRTQKFNEHSTGLNQYNSDRTFNYGQAYDDLTYKRDANNTAYNRGRDTILDEQTAAEQKRLADDAAFDRKYKVTVLENDEKTTAYNKAIDRFEFMGTADAQTAKDLGVTEGMAWGGQEAEMALQQSKLNLEQTQATINNINKDTAYVGVNTGSGGSSGGSSYTEQTDAAIIAAYTRIENGEGTAEDRALLAREGIDISNVSGDTGGTEEYDAAMARWKAGTGTDADRKVLEENNVPKETLDKYQQTASPQMDGGIDESWKADYDKASLDKLMIKYPNLTEEQIDANVSSGKFVLKTKGGVIYVGESTKANH